jgi:uncharacterized surface protein with fasciclin (FAS1) repeats
MNVRSRLILAFSVIAIGLNTARVQGQDIVDTAAQAGQFNTLVAAVKAAGLVDALKAKGPFTVFAPTDEAFAALPEGTVESLLKKENRDQLVAILTYHVVPGNVAAKDAYGLREAQTLNGQNLAITTSGGTIQVDQANLIKTDIKTSNGTIHVIDKVLLPETKSIPEVAQGAGTFQTLLAAAQAADLVGVLGSTGPFTVFAPTDEAFAKLPAGTVESLLKEENRDQLVAILKYHVVAGRIDSTTAVKAGEAKTLQGQKVKIGYDSGLAINQSRVVAADIKASNGVIHVIDAVLLPAEKDPKDGYREVCDRLDQAVSHGARLYNRRQHSQCCAVYKAALQEIAEMSETLGDEGTSAIHTALRKAEHEHHMGRRAWIYRHAIDRTYHMMSEQL